jgi:hypothetical protein
MTHPPVFGREAPALAVGLLRFFPVNFSARCGEVHWKESKKEAARELNLFGRPFTDLISLMRPQKTPIVHRLGEKRRTIR